jgi:hypothetical protein
VTATETTTAYRLKGKGYEFCNCQPGCTCNFSGFPTSPDGSCKAAVGVHITEGHCGDVALNDIKAVAIIDWPKAIHDGNGKAIFVVPPAVTDEQLGCLAQIFTGQLGGLPWSILGTTFEVAGVVRVDVDIADDGINSGSPTPASARRTQRSRTRWWWAWASDGTSSWRWQRPPWVLVVRSSSGRNTGVRSTAEDVLTERFARGEIDEDEYDRRRDVLSR